MQCLNQRMPSKYLLEGMEGEGEGGTKRAKEKGGGAKGGREGGRECARKRGRREELSSCQLPIISSPARG